MKYWTVTLLSALLSVVVAACGGGNTPPANDGDMDTTESLDSDLEPDASDSADPAENPDLEERQEEPDIWHDPVPDDDRMPEAFEETTEDPTETPDLPPEQDLESDPDPEVDNEPEGLEDDVQPAVFCTRVDECLINEVCNFSLGRCEPRAIWVENVTSVFSFHPLAAAAGDQLVIDGRAFYTSLLGSFNFSVTIGSQTYTSFNLALADENRIVISLPSGFAGGAITVTAEGGAQAQAEGSVTVAATGVISCDGSTPAASGLTATALGHVGPYQAGYVDIAAHSMRLYYPSQCGGLRRPPSTGVWPLVVMLHGNGCNALNYEYLLEFLATHGFISINPASNSTNSYDEEVINGIAAAIEAVRGKELSSLHPVLAGLTATSQAAFVGHSRGTGRMEDVYDTRSAIRENAVASIFLGPVENGTKARGLFLLLAASGDLQALPGFMSTIYNRQDAPKWMVMIEGGNHSLFTDHKIWSGIGDQAAQIWRQQQHQVVLDFSLPLLQRAFGRAEPFAAQLDNPPQSSLYTVTHAP